MSFLPNVTNITQYQKGQIVVSGNGIGEDKAFCILNKNSTETFAFGDALRVVGISGTQRIVDKATSTTDEIFGFIDFSNTSYSLKKGFSISVLKSCEAFAMEASEAIAVGYLVEYVPTGSKVAVKDTGKVLGKAITAAAADGDLLLVQLRPQINNN